MTQRVASRPIVPSGADANHSNTLAAANPAMNGYPSRRTGTSCPRIEAITDMEASFRGVGRCNGLGLPLFVRLDRGRLLGRRRIAVRRPGFLGDPRQPLARLLGFALAVPHAGIEAAAGEQRLVCAAL